MSLAVPLPLAQFRNTLYFSCVVFVLLPAPVASPRVFDDSCCLRWRSWAAACGAAQRLGKHLLGRNVVAQGLGRDIELLGSLGYPSIVSLLRCGVSSFMFSRRRVVLASHRAGKSPQDALAE